MDALRVGRSFRAIRKRKGLRQQDVADRAACARSVVADAEAGRIGGMTLDRLGAITTALEADLDVFVRWHGERLDRLIDQAHAGLVEQTVTRLTAVGWRCDVEATFSIWGERGSIDVLAWFERLGIVLVVEVKSAFGDIQATVAGLDRKCRLAPVIGAERGWKVAAVSGLLVVGDSRSNRRVVERHRSVFDVAFPLRGVPARRWLAAPRPASVRALAFLPFVADGDARQRSRVRRRDEEARRTPNRPKSLPPVAAGDA